MRPKLDWLWGRSHDCSAPRGKSAIAIRDDRVVKARIALVYIVIAIINVGAWVWTLFAFQGRPALLGIAVLIYGLGLRHALDADHIAAIDNVTRKQMQQNRRPVCVGFWFAVGHSSIVIFVAAAIIGATRLLGHFRRFQSLGAIVSSSISATFLLAIAVMNIVIFMSVLRSYRTLRAGGKFIEEDLNNMLDRRGFMSRIFRPVFRLVSESWHMIFLGFLFGLGFDTATEIAMFGISVEQVNKGLSVGFVAVFPVLFAAGMLLVDTTDGVMMLGAYDWAFVKPIRKVFYNLTITLVSAIVALLIGILEVLGLVNGAFELKGGLWKGVARLNANFNGLGVLIVAIFIIAWGLSYLIYRAKRLDDLDV